MPRFVDQKEIERLYYEQLRNEWKIRREKRLAQNFKVFVSYSREDRDRIEALLKLLEEKKIRYFLDERNIEWGDSLPKSIEQHIEESTHLLFCLSPSSYKSEWCMREYDLALDKNVKRLVFMLEKNYLPPLFAKAELATDDIEVAEKFLSKVFVDETEVQFFLDNDLFKNFAQLNSFIIDPEYEYTWALDEEAKAKSWVFKKSAFMDSPPSNPLFELIKVGVYDFNGAPGLDFEYGTKVYQTVIIKYILKYVKDYQAVMVHRVGAGNSLELDQTTRYYTEEDVPFYHFDKFVTGEAGDVRYWGWKMSEDFWLAIVDLFIKRISTAVAGRIA